MFAWRDNFISYNGPSSANDPYWTSVSLLENFEIPQGSAIDSSTINAFITTVNNPQPSLRSPFSTGGSMKFGANVNNGYLSLPTNTNYTITSGVDYTIECWFYLLTTPNGGALVSALYPSGPGLAIGFGTSLGLSTGSTLFFGYYTSSWSGILSSGGTPSLNVWHHVAVCRVGSTVTLYLDGSSVGTASLPGTYTANNGLYIGRRWDTVGTVSYTDCFISNVRLVQGVAVYTSTFTPSTQPLPATQSANTYGNPSAAITSGQTKLLVNFTNQGLANNSYFVDSSIYSAAMTTGGTVVPLYAGLTPFTNTYPGSTYFNGSGGASSSGGYLATTTATANYAFGTGDWTIEFWVYIGVTGVNQCFVDMRNGGNFALTMPVIDYLNGTQLRFYTGGAARITSATGIFTAGNWYAIALCKVSGSTRMYVNGSQVGTTYTDSNNYSTSTNVNFGRYADGTFNYFNGYMTNLRLLKGTGLYSGSTYTVPTTPLTAITNTVFLFTAQGGYQDLSNQGQRITNTSTNTTITNSQYKFGNQSSNYIATSYQTVSDATSLQFGTGDFTIEGWVYRSASGVVGSIICKGAATTGWLLQINSSNQLTWTSTNTIVKTSVTTIPATTWTYFAITRTGTTGYMFINGTQEGATYSDTGNYNQPVNMLIGVDRGSINGLSGYLDDLRITKGVCRYTSSFSAPSSTFPTS